MNTRVALSRLLNTFVGGRYDEMLSSRAYRESNDSAIWYAVMTVLDTLFFWDTDHCKSNYDWERRYMR